MATTATPSGLTVVLMVMATASPVAPDRSPFDRAGSIGAADRSLL
jgi:hypothetical protein